MSLKWKIAVSLASIGVVMTATLGLVTYRSTQQRLIDEVDRSIAQSAQLVVLANERPSPRRTNFDVYSVRSFDRRGDLTGSTFATEAPIDARVVRAALGERGVVSIDTVTDEAGERIRIHTFGVLGGAVQVGRSLDETDAVLEDLRRRTVGLVAIAMLVSALAGWLIASRVAAPLRRLAASADEVGSTGRLDVSMPSGAERSTDEVGQLARAFSSMLGALGRSRADQERLVQDAGHELRTPLTSLRTNLAVLRRHPEMADDMRDQILVDLDGEVDELADLVDELVMAASGELLTQPAEDLDLVAVASHLAARVSHRRSRDVRVDGIGPIVVTMPRAGLERALVNLLENACKFDTSGGPIDVRVAAGSEGSAAFSVSDRGPGIPSDDLERIFDRFHRTEATRSMPGSGLGLAIVRDVITAQGGTVNAANRDGGGAVIGFVVPAADASSSAGSGTL